MLSGSTRWASAWMMGKFDAVRSGEHAEKTLGTDRTGGFARRCRRRLSGPSVDGMLPWSGMSEAGGHVDVLLRCGIGRTMRAGGSSWPDVDALAAGVADDVEDGCRLMTKRATPRVSASPAS